MVAVFLAVGLKRDEWRATAIIWPVAALLFVMLWMIIKSILVARLDKK